MPQRTVRETGAPNRVDGQAETPAHRCFNVQELCELRQAVDLPKALRQRVFHQLSMGCPACWQALEEVRAKSPPRLLPTTSPVVRMLRTLTIGLPFSLRPRHRQAARLARTRPLGTWRLLLEEILVITHGRPEATVAELEALMTQLGEIPAEREARLAWYDLRADLEAHLAVAWAHRLQPGRATAALERAALHRTAGSGAPEGAVNLLLARAQHAFHGRAGTAAWRAPYSDALALLHTEAQQPRRLEVLNELGCLLAEANHFEEAHGHLLEGLQIAGKVGESHPVLHLGVLHNLVYLESRVAREGEDDPPNFGLFLSLALYHFQQAERLYAEWGHRELEEDGDYLGGLLLAVGEQWTTPGGLRAQWNRLAASGAVPALPAVQLLGLAAVFHQAPFAAQHRAEVWLAVAASTVARTRLRGFLQVLRRLHRCVDEVCQRAIIGPWLTEVKQMPGLDR